MSAPLWFLILLIAAFAAHWGAERLSKPLRKLTRQWGLTAVAAGAMLALFTAGGEVMINATSALRGVGNIGLGMTFGSSIVHIPAIVTVVYLATRKERLGREEGQDGEQENNVQNEEAPEQHQRHVAKNLLYITEDAVSVVVIPYLLIVVLIAILTVPAAWRGLQPLDGIILVAAYAVFLVQAILRWREQGEAVDWSKKEIGLAVAGVVVMGFGAYWMVRATENIVSSLGISNLIGGLFITALVGSAPEWFSSWKVARSGQVTAAGTVVIGDHAVTLTVGLLPLALVTLPVDNFLLYVVSLAFVALIPALYGAFIRWGSDEPGFSRWQVVVLVVMYLLYVGLVLFWVTNIL